MNARAVLWPHPLPVRERHRRHLASTALAAGAVAALMSFGEARAQSITVNVATYAELFTALNQANAQFITGTTPHVINLTANIALPAGSTDFGVLALPPIFNSVTINGNGHTIDAQNQSRIFFIGVDEATRASGAVAGSIIANRPQVEINNVTLSNGNARGGNGSGGGMGAGGALFVNASADVRLSNVSFAGNAARGGNGDTVNGGGGGMGGNGVDGGGGLGGAGELGGGGLGGRGGTTTGGGGGGYTGNGAGFSSAGFPANSGPANSRGIAGLNGSGGSGGNGGGAGGANGGGGGGGAETVIGAFTTIGGGGGGGFAAPVGPGPTTGASGAFGGGGGAGGFQTSVGTDSGGSGGFGGGAGAGSNPGSNSIVGGFGGGGGAALSNGSGGAGGFGGGGGAAAGGAVNGGSGGFGGGGGKGGGAGTGGVGGFGAGNGTTGGGGGGAGMGGAVFVVQGGSLTISGAGTVSGGVVAGGTGANNGSAFGSGFFLHGNGALVFNPGTSETRTISDVIADQTGNGGTGANAGSWSITKNGAGTLVLGAANTFSGGATLNAGSLRLLNNTSAGTGAITANGSVISYGNGVTLSNPVTLNSNTTQVEVLGTDSATQSGVISETGGARPLEKIGTGTLTLNAANTYTGTTNVSAGTLRLGAAGSLASGSNLTLANGATFDLNGRTQSFGAVNGAAGSFLTLGAGALTLGAGNATSSVASVISGTGTLTKTGTGTLTLSGNNNYSGGTVISGGRVILNNIAGLGTGTAGFSGGSLHSNVSGTLANNLSLGSGSDTRLSASTGQTVTLTGTLNWGGGGTSTLRFGSPSDQGTFVWTIPSGTLTDPVGTTRIIAVEGGTLRAGNGVLSAATAFQNMTTRIDAGATLDFNGIGSTIRNLQGAGTLTNSVNTFIQSGNFSGTITGAGSISTNFLTTLILSGNNTYTGTTTISGATTRLEIGAGGTTGTLGTGNVINNGQLVFNRSNTYEVANVISGTGSLTQNGTGTLNLSGNSTYTGATLVNAGTLRVNGSIGSSSGVTVAAGASLGGNGTLPSLTINGTLAPGNSIGTVTVNGNLTLGAGSTTEIEVEGSTADRINVTGTANLSGNLRLVGLGGAYRFNAPYTILQAGSRVGTFNTTTTVGNFGIGVVPSISYIGARVDLTLTPAVLTTVLGGGTPGAPVASATPLNPASVANAIDRAVRAGTDVGAFFPIFNQSSVGALTEALGQVSGEVHSALPALAFEATTRFHSAMQDPHVAGRDGKPSAPRGSGPGQIGRRHYRLWASADGIYGVAHGNASIGSQRRNDRYGGFHAGVDLDLTPQIIAGLALGFGHGHAHLAHGYGRMDTGFIHLGTHVAASFGAFSLRASAAHSWTESRTSRHIPVFGASATAKYKASIWSGRVEGAYALLDHAGVTVAPFLALAASSTRNDRFLENSVINAISVIGGQTNRNSVRAEAGLQIAYRTTLSGMSLSFDTRLAYAHSLAHEIRSTHTLAGLSGQTFTIRGAKPDRAAALLSAGATLALSDRTTLSLRAGAELARKAAAGSASAKLNIHF